MRFGFHVSIAGGFSRVVRRAQTLRCRTIQIFSRNPRGWGYKPLDPKEVTLFRAEIVRASIHPVSVHLPYLVNLAARGSDVYDRSLRALGEELRRAEALSATYVTMHMGSRRRGDDRQAVRTLAQSINRVLRDVDNGVILLLENMSGQGGQLGGRFDEIGAVIDRIEDGSRIGICFDTAHAFGAGYDVSTPQGLDSALKEFHRCVGLDRVHLVHLNDTKVPLGSGKDRHWHIGQGLIGMEGFRRIVNDPRLVHLPGIMETPRDNDQDDLENMRVIRRLAG